MQEVHAAHTARQDEQVPVLAADLAAATRRVVALDPPVADDFLVRPRRERLAARLGLELRRLVLGVVATPLAPPLSQFLQKLHGVMIGRVRFLPAAAAGDEAFVEHLSALINRAYATFEQGLFSAEQPRTGPEEVARDVRAGRIAAVEDGEAVIGCVETGLLDDGTGWFGQLAVDPARAGRGVGSALVAFAEERAAAEGADEMQIELLAPQGGHPHTDRLRDWYARRGYRPVGRRPYGALDPDGVSSLAVPIEVVVLRKRLGA